MKAILATQIYDLKNQSRFKEILDCLYRNSGLTAINNIILFINPKQLYDYVPKNDRIIYLYPEKHITFKECFNQLEIAKKRLYPKEDCLLITANSDIFFTNADISIAMSNITEHQAYALSRWDIKHDGKHLLYDRRDSQDTWMFKNMIKLGQYDIELGRPGCDNRILYELEKAGYEVINPSKTIKTFHQHIHKSDTYNDNDKIVGEYSFRSPVFL